MIKHEQANPSHVAFDDSIIELSMNCNMDEEFSGFFRKVSLFSIELTHETEARIHFKISVSSLKKKNSQLAQTNQ